MTGPIRVTTHSDLFPHERDIVVVLSKVVIQKLDRAFTSCVDVSAPLKVTAFLVDGVISQVHVQLILMAVRNEVVEGYMYGVPIL